MHTPLSSEFRNLKGFVTRQKVTMLVAQPLWHAEKLATEKFAQEEVLKPIVEVAVKVMFLCKAFTESNPTIFYVFSNSCFFCGNEGTNFVPNVCESNMRTDICKCLVLSMQTLCGSGVMFFGLLSFLVHFPCHLLCWLCRSTLVCVQFAC